MIFITVNALISITALLLQLLDFKCRHQRNPRIYDFQYFAVIILFCIIPLVNIVPLLDGLLISVTKYIQNSGD
jgi:hypothetical protein